MPTYPFKEKETFIQKIIEYNTTNGLGYHLIENEFEAQTLEELRLNISYLKGRVKISDLILKTSQSHTN